MFLKVTTNIVEFQSHSGTYKKPRSTVVGDNYKGMIWVRRASFGTILNQLVYYSLSWDKDSGNLRLFFDVLIEAYMAVHGLLFYKDWRLHWREVFNGVKNTWEQFLDFTLCREVNV